jgi:hypothetical protein
MTTLAGLQVICVMAARVAIGNIVGLDYLRLILQRHRMRHMALRTFRNVRFFCMRDIAVRRNGLTAGCFEAGRFFGELVKGSVTGEACLSNCLLFRALSAILHRCRCEDGEESKQQHQYHNGQKQRGLSRHGTPNRGFEADFAAQSLQHSIIIRFRFCCSQGLPAADRTDGAP